MALTREEILGRKRGHETVTLPSGGEVVVRGLTRDQALALRGFDNVADRDNYVIACGLVEPSMDIEDVEQWAAEGVAGDFIVISTTISRLSGMNDGQAKEQSKSVPRRKR